MQSLGQIKAVKLWRLSNQKTAQKMSQGQARNKLLQILDFIPKGNNA